MSKKLLFQALFLLAAIAGLSQSANAQSLAEHPPTPPPPHEPQAAPVEDRLKVFDTLDFDVFSNQKWDRLRESHAEDIVVTWPDGHETKGIAKHIEDLKALFVFAPDIQIKEHPIRFGSGTWTAVTGVMTGTFSKPMPIADVNLFRRPANASRLEWPRSAIGMARRWIMNGCFGTTKTS